MCTMEKMGLDVVKQIVLQYKKYDFINASKNIVYNFFNREQRKSFGNRNSNCTIYIIRSINDNSPLYIGQRHNLLANYFYVLSHIRNAFDHGWIPVVDQLNYPVYNKEPGLRNLTSNPWEYFWNQPSLVSLPEAYDSKHVIFSKRSWVGQYDMGYSVRNYFDRDLIDFYHTLSNCVCLNTVTSLYVDDCYNQYIKPHASILGVNVRVGGYSTISARYGAGHPIQPPVDALLDKVYCRKREWNLDYIFLACDASSVINKFKDKFGDSLITIPRQRALPAEEEGLDRNKEMYRRDNLFKTTLDYLTEMELLAKCNALIGSITSGFRYAIVRNGNRFEHLDVLDYGLFDDWRKKNE